MEKFLFIILFFTGAPPLVQPVIREYHLIQQGTTWTDAQAYCRTNFDDLATIETSDDIVKIQNVSQSQQFISNAWIGLYTEKSGFFWSMGNESLGSWTSWYSSQPSLQDQLCTLVAFSTGWWDMPCDSLRPFVCFDASQVGNAAYILVTSSVTWYDAQSYCRQHYTDLASARSLTEYQMILKPMSGVATHVWIGLFREPWKWSDQSNLTINLWMLKEPDNALGNQNCGYISNGLAADAQCSDIMYFFCHKIVYPRRLWTIKVRVQSNQDVNGPALKEAILEKIKQTAQAYGMPDNTTVDWKVYQNGVVFHKEKDPPGIAEQNCFL